MKPNGETDKLSPAVSLTGTAQKGKLGPPMGVVDIGVSDQAYLCRITLPGLRKNESDVVCDIKRDGTVNICGVLTLPEMTKNSSTEYQMIVQELNPCGKFSISFCLPGPVDPRLLYPNFRPDGIFEMVVFKPKERPAV